MQSSERPTVLLTRPEMLFASWPSDRQILKTLYVLTSCLCAMMVFWILIFPGSWMIGHWERWERIVRSTLELFSLIRYNSTDPSFQVVPPDIALKYKGHTAVQLTHFVPAAVWAATIPFQLHPDFRKNHPRWHRRIGYLFVSVTIPMMAGVVLIMMRGLFFENFFPELPKPPVSGQPFLMVLSCWFVYTAGMAVYCARKKQFQAHQRYIIRHVGSGMWVAIQRFLLMTVYNHSPPFTRQQQRDNFASAAQISFWISLACAEYGIILLERVRGNKLNKVE